MQPSVSCETCKCLAGARGGRRGGSDAGCAVDAEPSRGRGAGCSLRWDEKRFAMAHTSARMLH